jgi:hypothetical protein
MAFEFFTDDVVVVARPQFRRLTIENSDVACAVAVEVFYPPGALKFEVGREGEMRGSSGRSFLAILVAQRSFLDRSSIV